VATRFRLRRARAFAASISLLTIAPAAADALDPGEIQRVLAEAHAKFAALSEGKNADYIPALAKVPPTCSGSRSSRPTARSIRPAIPTRCSRSSRSRRCSRWRA
jgi:glutaminase